MKDHHLVDSYKLRVDDALASGELMMRLLAEWSIFTPSLRFLLCTQQ